jgi:O-antigen/teichoic acid export membrane protein
VVNDSPYKSKALHAQIVSGSAVLLAGSSLTTLINLAYNVVIALFLGPAGFGHATVVYTLLTILSALALAFQIVNAKVVAQQSSLEAKAQAYRVLHRAAWACGTLVAVVLLLFRVSISNYLNLPDPVLVEMLAVGSGFFVPLGCRRGWIQGIYGFRSLAINLALEGAVRLLGSYALIIMGFGLRGVIAANAASIVVAYLAIAPKLAAPSANPLRLGKALRETYQGLTFYAGQTLINNFDIVLVKHLFSAEMAGLYAAVALVGRVISALSSAVVNTMFPLVAGTGEKERKDLRVIVTSLLLVLVTGSLFAIGLSLTPAWVWTKCLGSGFRMSGAHDLSYLATLYAIKSVIYSLSVVFITFEMAYKIASSSAVQLAFSILLIAGVYEFHSSLLEVILVQIALLAVLAVFSAVPLLIDLRSGRNESDLSDHLEPIWLTRRVSEDEVIAEFLKSDFRDAEFRECPVPWREIIVHPNLADARQNAKRRAMHLLRHLTLWNEIPRDTEWYEVQINELALEQVRVFPRAQWRKLARGNFAITRIAEDVRARRHKLDAEFISKITALEEQLREGNREFGTVILLGHRKEKPVTVLDGNHRLVATMLTSAGNLSGLRFMCGLSERMDRCCWYRTNFATLCRYARNLFVVAVRNPRGKLLRSLREGQGLKPEKDVAGELEVGRLVEADDTRI